MEIKLPGYLRAVVILFGIVLIVHLLVVGKQIIAPLLFSAFLAFLTMPLAIRLEKLKVPRIIASILCVLAITIFLAGVLYFFITQLGGFTEEIPKLREALSEKLQHLKSPIEEYIDLSSVSFSRVGIFDFIQENITVITGGIISTAGNLTVAFMIPVYLVLLLFYRDFLYEFLLKAFGEVDKPEKIRETVLKVRGVIFNYLSGMFFVILILFVLNSIALTLLGVENALLFAAFAAILNVIPFVGPLIGSIIPISYTFITHESLWIPFGVFLSFYVIQLMESNFFTPKIVGSKVSMNPLMTLLIIFIGALIWGFVGMILFIPLLAMLKIIFDQIDPLKPYGYLLGEPEKPAKVPSAGLFKKIGNFLKKD